MIVPRSKETNPVLYAATQGMRACNNINMRNLICSNTGERYETNVSNNEEWHLTTRKWWYIVTLLIQEESYRDYVGVKSR